MGIKYHSKHVGLFVGVTLFVGAVVAYLAIHYWQREVERERLLAELKSPEQSAYLQKLWRWGDFLHLWEKGRLRCSKLPLWKKDIGSNFLRCNPLFLQCIFENQLSEYLQSKEAEISFTPYDSGNIYRYDLDMDQYHIRFFIGKQRRETQEVILPNQCQLTELPQKVYGYGTLNKKNDWLWDNLNYSIWVDRRYVNNFEVNEWRRAKKMNVVTYQSKDLFRPSTDLRYSQMIEYCRDHQKELLNARVLDALGSYIIKEYQLGDRYLDRSPYPWRGRESAQFIYFAQTDRNFVYNTKYCEQIYTKECLGKSDFGIQKLRAEGLGGVSNVLGGFPEAVLNKRYPEWNLAPSSFIFPLYSRWHRAGARAKWNGLLADQQQVIWMEESKKYGDFPQNKGEKIPITFRCMKMESWEK